MAFKERKPMSGKSSGDPKKQKKPYKKPEVKRVELKPEEAVLGNCKHTSVTGPALSNCNLAGAYCYTNGS